MNVSHEFYLKTVKELMNDGIIDTDNLNETIERLENELNTLRDIFTTNGKHGTFVSDDFKWEAHAEWDSLRRLSSKLKSLARERTTQ